MSGVELKNLLDPKLVEFGVEVQTRDDLIRKMAQRAIDEGFASEGYAEDVIERENLYPTGLPTEVLKVTVPHAMTQAHVIKPVIVIAKLQHSVVFKEMGDGENDCLVDMAFMLVTKGDKEYLAVLQQLICVFSVPEYMTQLDGIEEPKAFIDKLIELAGRAL